MKIKNRHFLKSGDIKKLYAKLQHLFPKSNNLFGKQDKVETGIMEDGTALFFINGELFFFEREGLLIPFLRILLKNLIQLPKIVIDKGAIPFIARGADVMVPGIVTTDKGFEKDDYVVIVDEAHNKPLAIGLVLMDEAELSSKKKGKGIKNVHYVGDRYWIEFSKLSK